MMGRKTRLGRAVWVCAAVGAATIAGATIEAGTCAAQEAASGRQAALKCQACHGLDGLGKIPGAPNIAGQPREYLVKSMHDYKTGARKNDMMSVVMPQVTDREIDLLADYYASIEVTAKIPQ